MDRKSLLFVFVAVLTAAVIFTGCPTGGGNDDPDTSGKTDNNDNNSNGGNNGNGVPDAEKTVEEKPITIDAVDFTDTEAVDDFVEDLEEELKDATEDVEVLLKINTGEKDIPVAATEKIVKAIPSGKTLAIDKGVTLNFVAEEAAVSIQSARIARAAEDSPWLKGKIRVKSGAEIIAGGDDYHTKDGKTIFEKGSSGYLIDGDSPILYLGPKTTGSTPFYAWDSNQTAVVTLGQNSLELTSGTVTVAKPTLIQAGDTLTIKAGAELRIATGVTFNIAGTLSNLSEGTITVLGTGNVTGPANAVLGYALTGEVDPDQATNPEGLEIISATKDLKTGVVTVKLGGDVESLSEWSKEIWSNGGTDKPDTGKWSWAVITGILPSGNLEENDVLEIKQTNHSLVYYKGVDIDNNNYKHVADTEIKAAVLVTSTDDPKPPCIWIPTDEKKAFKWQKYGDGKSPVDGPANENGFGVLFWSNATPKAATFEIDTDGASNNAVKPYTVIVDWSDVDFK
jgi:uncharacterized FlaG/YvyC family protein